MKALLAPLRTWGDFDTIRKKLQKKQTALQINGCADSQKLHLIAGLTEDIPNRLIITGDETKVQGLYEDFQIYDTSVIIYPAKDLIFFQADINGNLLTMQRMKCLRRLLEGEPVTIITTFDALMEPMVPLSRLRENVITLEKGSQMDEQALAGHLVRMGYEKAAQVRVPGEFSIRGGIVDVYDLTEENPYRIDFWGDEVDSLHIFDAFSQRSLEELDSVSVYPASEFVLSRAEKEEGIRKIAKESADYAEKLRKEMRTEAAHRVETQSRDLSEQLLEFDLPAGAVNLESYIRYFYDDLESFLDFFPEKDSCIFADEPARIQAHIDAVETEFSESMLHRMEGGYILPGQMNVLYGSADMKARLTRRRIIALSEVLESNALFTPEAVYDIHARNVAPYQNSFDALVKDLNRYCEKGYRILLLSASRMRAQRIAGDLYDRDVLAVYSDDPERETIPGEVLVRYGRMRKGFVYPDLKFVVISESDVFGTPKSKKKKRRFSGGQVIQDFAELHPGDYVVHESHGLGVYRGIEKVEVEHITKDYLKIEYRDGANLYVSVTDLSAIQKYAAADAATPRLNKLGSSEWVKTKGRVREAVEEIAQDLVNLYAARQQQNGYQYGPDTIMQQEFEETFPYEETEGQLAAIEATKADMESTKIMDRLICGDVGFGKTEVAIRAAFKAVQESKQVVYLVPTTILAQQHYNTFRERMKDYPVRIDLLSRFRTEKEQAETLRDLAKGLVDIVIGTHRVLSKDVVYKDLGLLIIDEEQRFGVKHKEKIKQLKETVDVLTLTATPIPRTLHMSLIGIRDMSLLEEAPENRLPIQTFVCEYNEELVREAISRELARGGQVYYIYNRINNIPDVAAAVQELVPSARVAFAHGRMQERDLERIMLDFVEGDIDVLVSTTIVETGMDIPNVNTLIVQDSERMGLAQLYQLRGRVGRSDRTAYAFLMFRKDRMLPEVAEKRLEAIREFSDLGSGYKIAMRDLELRGAGNLLGAKQHGHLQAVGYDLYCKMLSEAVLEKKGEEILPDFETTMELQADAFIPPDYIPGEMQKLEIYKRIAGLEDEQEASDMKDELTDRFGTLPRPVENLLRISMMRVSAHRLFVTKVQGMRGSIKFLMKPDAKLRVENIPRLVQQYAGRLIFQSQGTPTFVFRYRKGGEAEAGEEQLLYGEKVLADMSAFLLLAPVSDEEE